MNTKKQSVITNILQHPDKNPSDKLVATLQMLDQKLQWTLMFDYVDHTTWICEKLLDNDPRFRRAIEVARDYLNQIASIEQLADADSDLYHAFVNFMPEPTGSTPSQAGHKAGWAIVQATLVCCRKELERIGRIVKRKQYPSDATDATDVARIAVEAVEFYALEQAQNDPDLVIKSQAEQIAKDAALAEARWQLAHLVEKLGLDIEIEF
jgi:hypothetical protein